MKSFCLSFTITFMQYVNVGKFIRRKRKEMKISLNAFALDSEVEVSTLSRVETKPQNVNVRFLAKIAKNFGMTLSAFLEEYENSQEAQKEKDNLD